MGFMKLCFSTWQYAFTFILYGIFFVTLLPIPFASSASLASVEIAPPSLASAVPFDDAIKPSPKIPRRYTNKRADVSGIPEGQFSRYGILLDNDPIEHKNYIIYYKPKDMIARGKDGKIYAGKLWDRGNYNPEEARQNVRPQRVAVKQTFCVSICPILLANYVKHLSLVPLITYWRAWDSRLQDWAIWLATPRWDTNWLKLMRSAVPLEEMLHFFHPLLEGIEALHSIGLVHGDLWVGNVLANVEKDDAGQAVGIDEAAWTDFAGIRRPEWNAQNAFLDDSFALGQFLLTLLSRIQTKEDIGRLPIFDVLRRAPTQGEVAAALSRYYLRISEELHDLLSIGLCTQCPNRIGVGEFRERYEDTPEYLHSPQSVCEWENLSETCSPCLCL